MRQNKELYKKSIKGKDEKLKISKEVNIALRKEAIDLNCLIDEKEMRIKKFNENKIILKIFEQQNILQKNIISLTFQNEQLSFENGKVRNHYKKDLENWENSINQKIENQNSFIVKIDYKFSIFLFYILKMSK